MNMRLIHKLHDSLELFYEGRSLFTYIYEPDSLPVESPRPYFHPLRTLAGNEVSLLRPHDHPWHRGLTMTMAYLSGENFWGGPTYIRAEGYAQLDNNGHMQHRAWQELSCHEELHAVERLQWISQSGAILLDEERQIVVGEINPQAGYWSLDLSCSLLNVSAQTLVFGSPTTEGRPDAGYGGLFWRGPRSFLHGRILAAGDLEGANIMGKPSPWLAFTGWHDGNSEQSTVVFVDCPANPRYPSKWFVRNDPYACVSCSFMFDEYYSLAPDETIKLAYRVVIGNGEWSRSQIEHYVTTTVNRPAQEL